MCPDTGEMTGCSGTSLLTIQKYLKFDVQKLESYSFKHSCQKRILQIRYTTKDVWKNLCLWILTLYVQIQHWATISYCEKLQFLFLFKNIHSRLIKFASYCDGQTGLNTGAW